MTEIAPLDELRRKLAAAVVAFRDPKGDGGRDGALAALAAVATFLDDVPGFRGLAVPLIALGQALADLRRGAVHPIFEPTNPGKADTRDRAIIIAFAAFTAHSLIRIGIQPKVARQMVAERLNEFGVRNVGGRRLTADTIRAWHRRSTEKPREDVSPDPARQAYADQFARYAPHLRGAERSIENGTVSRDSVAADMLAGLARVIAGQRDRSPKPRA